MHAYEPLSRRPIAEIFRRTARGATAHCVRVGIPADLISYSSIAFAALAALSFWQAGAYPLLLVVAPFFCFLRLWCNMLDGMVALAGGKASRRGEIINDLPDRISDVIIFVGAAHSGWMHPHFGYGAAIMSLGTAYVGVLGQAVGVQREFSGWMSKPWRMVVLALGAWLSYGFFRFQKETVTLFDLTILDWACVLVVAGCLQTSTQRLLRIFRALKETTH
jgi:phosphatidylglycerophosphate synthase